MSVSYCHTTHGYQSHAEIEEGEMPENPLERDVRAAEDTLRRQFDVIDRAVGEVAPVGKRMLTRREKLMRALATPARSWAPLQAQFVLRELLKGRNGRS